MNSNFERLEDTKEKRDKIVNYIFCNCNRGDLEELAKEVGYKPENKNRHQLEEIGFLNILFRYHDKMRYSLRTVNKDILKDVSFRSLVSFLLSHNMRSIASQHEGFLINDEIAFVWGREVE